MALRACCGINIRAVAPLLTSTLMIKAETFSETLDHNFILAT
jgi:hypothetical protein